MVIVINYAYLPTLLMQERGNSDTRRSVRYISRQEGKGMTGGIGSAGKWGTSATLAFE